MTTNRKSASPHSPCCGSSSSQNQGASPPSKPLNTHTPQYHDDALEVTYNKPHHANNMNETSNVLVQYTLQDLDRRAESNFWLGIVCLAVCAINMVLLFLNWSLHHADPAPHVSHKTFHLLEFWTSNVYAIAEAFALVTSPKTMLHIYSKPNLLKLLLFFNVVNSLVPALLITLDLKYFETTAHELEFFNSFTLSFITMILLASLLKPPPPPPLPPSSSLQDDHDNQNHNKRSNRSVPTTVTANRDVSSIVMGIVACGVAATNFIVYNAGHTEIAHCLEFTFNMVISLITFWFCMDNRFVAQMEIGQILYGKHQNCSLCQERTSDFQIQMRSSLRWQILFGDRQDRGGPKTNNNDNAVHYGTVKNELAPLIEEQEGSTTTPEV